jgi:hypothetical protein
MWQLPVLMLLQMFRTCGGGVTSFMMALFPGFKMMLRCVCALLLSCVLNLTGVCSDCAALFARCCSHP